MSIDGITGLDHLVIATRDLDAARDAYTRLGLTVTPRGHHTQLKSANHTILFPTGTYLELLGIEEQRPANAHYAAFLRHGEGMRLRIVNLNGEWGLLRFFGDTLESAQTFETDGERIFRIQVQRNPLKLARIVAALRAEAG